MQMGPRLTIFYFFVTVGAIEARGIQHTKDKIVGSVSSGSSSGSRNWFWGKSFGDREVDWEDECGCTNSTYPKILVVSRRPVKCACMIDGYEIDEAPGGIFYTTVYNKFHSISVLNVDSEQKMLSLNISFSYKWEDQRINATSQNNEKEISFAAVSPKEKLPIWQPKRSCDHCDPDEKMSFSKIGFLVDQFNRNSTFVTAALLWKTNLMCDFDFSKFPFDRQSCGFRLNSKSSGNVLDLLYGNESKMIIQVPDVDTFEVMANIIGRYTDENDLTDQIGFDIKMRRRIEPYFFEYYFPCVTVVTISSVSFAIPLTAIPGRVTLSVVLILTLMNLFTRQAVSELQELKTRSYKTKMVTDLK